MDNVDVKVIDYGFARQIIKEATTTNVGSSGNIAPEIFMRSDNYNSEISKAKYSYSVDVYGSGLALLDTIEPDFLRSFRTNIGITKSNKSKYDDYLTTSFLTLFCKHNRECL